MTSTHADTRPDDPSTRSTDARADWEERIYRPSVEGDDRRAAVPDLPPPADLTATAGVGHVTLRWPAVEGAVGYLVHRADAEGTPLEVADHGGADVRPVPDTCYVDTLVEPGRTYRYAVASVPEVDVCGTVGAQAVATPWAADGSTPVVGLHVGADAPGDPLPRPWQPMIGSERLSQLLSRDRTGGREIGAEMLDALRRVRDEIGVQTVRAHAILHDDLGVYREVDGEPVHDFTRVDEVYDLVLRLGLRPCVEIGFTPRDLASDTTKAVFGYTAFISPPKDYDRWYALVRDLVAHLVARYGLAEVRRWDFEVWNEANLEVFWSGTRDEWMHLYDVTAAAVRSVDDRLKVGGPGSAATRWVEDLLAHVTESGSPVDFVSTHTYGNAPLDMRPILARYGHEGTRILWTEWGVSSTHFNPVNDGVSAATFLLHGMRSAAGRLEALSYWVASDHFEELGRPPRLLHGGFGLLTVGGIAKARFHALSLLARLGPVELPVTASGDGADGLVQSWASRREDGSLAVLVWNHTLDQSRAQGDPALARTVRLTLDGAPAGDVRVTRLDHGHGDVTTLADSLGVGDWPTDDQWEALRAADTLVAEPAVTTVGAGTTTVELAVPQPGAVLVELSPSA